MMRYAVIAAVAAVAVAGLYAVSTVPDAFIYDDELLVGKPPAPRSVSDLTRIFREPHYGNLPYYRPLARLSYTVQKAAHGNSPVPYRAANGILAGLILLAAFLLLRTPVFRLEPVFALLAATWFTVHPVASSCVYPVSGRETLLPTLFGLLAVAAHVRDGPWWRLASTALFALALFSKEQAVAVLALFVLYDLLLRERTSATSWLRRYAPSVAVLAVYLLARGQVLQGPAPAFALFRDPTAPLKSLAYGLQSTVVPGFELIYEPPFDAWFALSRLLPAVVVAACVGYAAWRQPAPVPRLALYWSGWFVLAQMPSANLLVQETRFDERYVFAGSLGFAALLATLFSATPPGAVRRAALVAGSIWIVALAAVGHHRASYFESAHVFHGQWARTNPASPNAHNGLGASLARAGRIEEAVAEYEEAVRLSPRHEQARNNLGAALLETGDPETAATQLEQALLLLPDYAEAHYNLGNTLAALGRADEATQHYREALRLRPDYVRAHNNYATLLAGSGRIDEALAEFAEVMRLDPTHFRSRLNYGILLARQGRFGDAVPHYREALRLDDRSADAHFDLGVALENLGLSGEAVRHYRTALELAESRGAARLAQMSRAGLARLESAAAAVP